MNSGCVTAPAVTAVRTYCTVEGASLLLLCDQPKGSCMYGVYYCPRHKKRENSLEGASLLTKR